MGAPRSLHLRPYQQDALTAVARAVQAGQRRLLLVYPPGTGKSTIAAALPAPLGLPALFLTHTKVLVDQHVSHLDQQQPTLRIGIEQDDREAWGDEDVIVASIPTLTAQGGRRLQRLAARPWAWILVDETHHALAPSWHDLLRQLHCFASGGPILIGTTATPHRTDQASLSAIFETIAASKSLREMIEAGWLAPLRAYTVETQTALDPVQVDRGDFVAQDLARAINTPDRNTIIVEAYRRLAEGRRAVCFCASTLHAESVALSFMRAGIEARSFTNKLSASDRAGRLQAFRAHRIQVLAVINMYTEGVDDPPLAAAIMARPTQSAILYVQSLGRITRTAPGKIDGLLLDLVDNTTRHRVQTITRVFGIPGQTRLTGQSVTTVLARMERVLGRHPHLSAQQFASADALLQAAETLDLSVTPVSLLPALAEEVEAEAQLRWIRLPTCEYLLPLQGAAALRIRENLLGQYEVIRLPAQEVLVNAATRHQAFLSAERTIRTEYPEAYHLAQQTADWHKLPPTTEQRETLAAAHMECPATRGEASILITKLMAERQGWRSEAATAAQRRFLERHGGWEDGLTKGEAHTRIQRLKAPAPDPARPTSTTPGTPMGDHRAQPQDVSHPTDDGSGAHRSSGGRL